MLALFAGYHALALGTEALDAEVARLCAERPYLPLSTRVDDARGPRSRELAASAALEVSGE